MNLGTGRTKLTGWRAGIACLLAVAFLLASLLVPPAAETAPSGASSGSAGILSVAADQDGGPGTQSRPHSLGHSGAHCACQLADRLLPSQPAAPTALIAEGHPTFAAHAHASLEAEPPARPPRA